MRKRSNYRWLAATGITCVLVAACASPARPDGPEKEPRKTISCYFGTSQPWFTKQQAEDGSFADDDGKPDIATTCLVALSLLGDGSTMRAGPDKVIIKKAVGWLRKIQRADGTFATGVGSASTEPNSTRQHALATYTLVEAAGLSKYRLLWNYTTPAVNALLARRDQDGGWRSDPSQPHGDAQTTALAALACMSARFFDHAAPEQPSNRDLMRWFDEHPAATGVHAAAELSCRHVAGQASGQLASAQPTTAQPAIAQPATAQPATAQLATARLAIERLADLVLAEATIGDPIKCLWSSNALYVAGGKHWQTWQAKLKPLTSITEMDADSDHFGSVEPAGGQGRTSTTALRFLTMQSYYRYSRLIR